MANRIIVANVVKAVDDTEILPSPIGAGFDPLSFNENPNHDELGRFTGPGGGGSIRQPHKTVGKMDAGRGKDERTTRQQRQDLFDHEPQSDKVKLTHKTAGTQREMTVQEARQHLFDIEEQDKASPYILTHVSGERFPTEAVVRPAVSKPDPGGAKRDAAIAKGDTIQSAPYDTAAKGAEKISARAEATGDRKLHDLAGKAHRIAQAKAARAGDAMNANYHQEKARIHEARAKGKETGTTASELWHSGHRPGLSTPQK